MMTRIRKLWANKDFIVSYLKWSLAAKPPDTSIKPLHIIFLFVDHFEPKFDNIEKKIVLSEGVKPRADVSIFKAIN